MSTQHDYASHDRQQFCRDRYAEARAAAIKWLGNRWRGLPDCRHEYTNSQGKRTERQEPA